MERLCQYNATAGEYKLGLENLAEPFNFLSHNESKAFSKDVSCARFF
jgi:hypothetical protein